MNRLHTYFTGLMALAIVLLISCTATESAPKAATDVKVTYVSDLEPGTSARFLISGMSCERMCVSAVKKGVSALPAVKIADMRFDADVPVDTLIVDFDSSQMDEVKIIEVIQSLAGGDSYKVIEVQLAKGEKTSLRRDASRIKRNSPDLDVSQYRFEVPNLLDIIRKVSI
jgi:copper chaperone CopZ